MIFLLADCLHIKHYTCIQPLLKYWIIDSNKQQEIKYYFSNQENIPSNLDAIIGLNKLSSTLHTRLKKKYPNIPFILIDHGCSNLKWFLNSWDRYDQFDIFLVPGIDHKLSLEAIHGTSKPVIVTAFINSDAVLSKPKIQLPKSKKRVILYAPTWFEGFTADHIEVIKGLNRLGNDKYDYIISLHPEAENRLDRIIDNIDIENDHIKSHLKSFSRFKSISTIDLVKLSDIIISDTSSILYEAAALDKTLIQILMQEYSDNPAKDYSLPYAAGTLERVQLGYIIRPDKVDIMIKNVFDSGLNLDPYPDSYYLNRVNIVENAVEIIHRKLLEEILVFTKRKSFCDNYDTDIFEINKKILVDNVFMKILNRKTFSNTENIYHQQYISPKGDTKVLQLVLLASCEYNLSIYNGNKFGGPIIKINGF